MNSDRIRLLEQYASEDPEDPFPAYALGLEFASEHPEKAKSIFNRLMTEHPDYVPVYYQAAMLTSSIGERELIVNRRIKVASAVGDLKAVAELKSLVENDESA